MNKRTRLFIFILTCIILILLWLYMVPRAFGQDYKVADSLAMDSVLAIDFVIDYTNEPEHSLQLIADGRILLDGNPVESMSHPEIVTILKSIVESLQRQYGNDSLLWHYERQTDYLLGEIERLQKELDMIHNEYLLIKKSDVPKFDHLGGNEQ